MNVFDEVQASRPDVDPMPLAKRRMIRESLFGLGHGDSTQSITRRSDSGAVVSTAPHGTRHPNEQRAPRSGSLMKVAAGLVLVAVIGAVVWSALTRGDEDAAPPQTTVGSTTTTSTIAPTTTVAPPVRTGVTTAQPVALPPDLIGAAEVSVDGAATGSSAMVLGAPDGSEVWVGEFDGDPAPASGLDVQQVGSVSIGVPSSRAPDAPPSYQLLVPCGLVLVNDAPGQPLDREAILDVFNATSVDAEGTIDIDLPADWAVFSVGESRPQYSARFEVPTPAPTPDSAETASLTLTQVPGGSFAQLMFGGRQLDPIDFAGAPGFIDIAPLNPSLVSVFWKDGDTVFNISSTELSVGELDGFVKLLEPATVADWNTRFATQTPAASATDSACNPQPNFGSTLRP